MKAAAIHTEANIHCVRQTSWMIISFIFFLHSRFLTPFHPVARSRSPTRSGSYSSPRSRSASRPGLFHKEASPAGVSSIPPHFPTLQSHDTGGRGKHLFPLSRLPWPPGVGRGGGDRQPHNPPPRRLHRLWGEAFQGSPEGPRAPIPVRVSAPQRPPGRHRRLAPHSEILRPMMLPSLF